MQRLTPVRGVRILLIAFCVLTAAGFVSLFVLADHTSAYFAWTIEPPVTAAFLGSGYGAGFLLSVLSVRAVDWAHIRVPFTTVTAFTWLTAAATFLHRDRLHDISPGVGPVAEPAAWIWLVVYVVVPVAMAAVLVLQGRARPAPGGARLPRWLAVALAVEGLTMGAVGLVLFVAPSDGARLWPWTLSPFTARVVAAWLLAFALAAVLAVRAGDLTVLRTATIAYASFGALQLVTVARFAGRLDQGDPRTLGYVLVLGAVTLTGIAGWVLARRTGVGAAPGRRVPGRRR